MTKHMHVQMGVDDVETLLDGNVDGSSDVLASTSRRRSGGIMNRG